MEWMFTSGWIIERLRTYNTRKPSGFYCSDGETREKKRGIRYTDGALCYQAVTGMPVMHRLVVMRRTGREEGVAAPGRRGRTRHPSYGRRTRRTGMPFCADDSYASPKEKSCCYGDRWWGAANTVMCRGCLYDCSSYARRAWECERGQSIGLEPPAAF